MYGKYQLDNCRNWQRPKVIMELLYAKIFHYINKSMFVVSHVINVKHQIICNHNSEIKQSKITESQTRHLFSYYREW